MQSSRKALVPLRAIELRWWSQWFLLLTAKGLPVLQKI